MGQAVELTQRRAVDRLDAALPGLLDAARLLDGHGKHQEALKTARKAVREAEKKREEPSRAAALNLLALQLLRLGENEDCVATAREAAALSERLGDHSRRSEALATQTMAMVQLGLPGEALSTVQLCIEAARQANDPLRLCWGLNRAGCVHYFMGEPSIAVEQLEEALTLARQLDDRDALYAALNNLSEAMVAHVKHLKRQGNSRAVQQALERGIAVSREGISVARAAGSTYQELMVQGNLGMLLGLRQPQDEEARQLLEDGVHRAEQHGYRPTTVIIRKYLAYLARLQGDLDTANQCYQELLRYAADHHDRAQAMEVHLELSESLKQAGNHEDALEHFQHYHRLQRARRNEVAETRARMMLQDAAGNEDNTSQTDATQPLKGLSLPLFSSNMGMLRAGLILGILLYGMFLFVDAFYLSDKLSELLWNRAAVLGLAFCVLAASFWPRMQAYIPEVLAGLHLAAGLGCLHLGYVFSGYIPCLYCGMVFFGSIPQTRLLYVGCVNAALVLGFIASHMLLPSPLAEIDLSFNASLLAATALTIQLGLYLREMAIQREHARILQLQETSRELGRTRETVTRQLEELEHRHKEVDADLKLAHRIQQQFMPREFPGIKGIQARGYYRPMAQVGGDFYDVIPRPDGGTALVIGDVSGHGVAASLITAMVKITCSMHVQHADTPGKLLQEMSKTLSNKTGHHFLTLFAAFVDPERRELQFANAGHCLPLIRRASTGAVEELRAEGTLLGLLESADYPDQKISLAPGDRLLFFTDGVSEARDDSRQMYGGERIRRVLREKRNGSAEETMTWLIEDLETFRGGFVFDDDIALLCVDICPEP